MPGREERARSCGLPCACGRPRRERSGSGFLAQPLTVTPNNELPLSESWLLIPAKREGLTSQVGLGWALVSQASRQLRSLDPGSEGTRRGPVLGLGHGGDTTAVARAGWGGRRDSRNKVYF